MFHVKQKNSKGCLVVYKRIGFCATKCHQLCVLSAVLHHDVSRETKQAQASGVFIKHFRAF